MIIEILNSHLKAFKEADRYAKLTKQPTPCDTAKWSQIFVSSLTGIDGLNRKKGTDLSDGSDVKGGNVWSAIDKPRFNGVVPSGRILSNYTNSEKIYEKIYFVLWDYKSGKERCRVWCVRPKEDKLFLEVVDKWYDLKEHGKIKSSNFQLHPPTNKNNNIFTNNCGNLKYPLLFESTFNGTTYEIDFIDMNVIESGYCLL